MKPSPAVSWSLLRPLGWAAALAALLAGASAHADDYADVNQLLGSGKFQEAMDKAERYLTAKPRDPQMRFIKSVIQSESGQPAAAMETLIALTQEYPELPEPYNNLAVLYAGQARLDQAREALEMAIRNRPDYAVAHENLGDVQARLAGQSYDRAARLDGTNPRLGPKQALIRNLLAPAAPTNPARQ
jgi:tetratricopeptide (TPR) repeat protein